MGKPSQEWIQALYLRRYIAGSHSKGYVYEKLDGLFLIDDKKGKDKIAKERETTTPYKLQHLSSASESKST